MLLDDLGHYEANIVFTQQWQLLVRTFLAAKSSSIFLPYWSVQHEFQCVKKVTKLLKLLLLLQCYCVTMLHGYSVTVLFLYGTWFFGKSQMRLICTCKCVMCASYNTVCVLYHNMFDCVSSIWASRTKTGKTQLICPFWLQRAALYNDVFLHQLQKYVQHELKCFMKWYNCY